MNMNKPITKKSQWSVEETKLRIELAAAYRLTAKFGMDDLIYTHLSARVPGADLHFLLNPYGLLFSEVTASSLIKVDQDGKIVDGAGGVGCTIRPVSSCTARCTVRETIESACSTRIRSMRWPYRARRRDCSR